jgi:hypothetical protein
MSAGINHVLSGLGENIPVFHVASLGQYCGVTDFVRRAWVEKVNSRQREDKLRRCVGEVLPWFRGAKDIARMLAPKFAREWIKCKHRRVRSDAPGNLDHKCVYDLEGYYFDRFTRFDRPFLEGMTPMDEIELKHIV